MATATTEPTPPPLPHGPDCAARAGSARLPRHGGSHRLLTAALVVTSAVHTLVVFVLVAAAAEPAASSGSD